MYGNYGKMPVPLFDGVSPTVGWQWLPDKEGGPAFAIIIRTRLGWLSVQERFPLTAEGWACAERRLAELSPINAAKVAQGLHSRGFKQRIP